MLPKELSLNQIRDILSRGAPHEFIDAFENEIIEFKSAPYRLTDDQQKAELAKDISAFANTLGGFIVLGIKTTKVPDHNADLAQTLRPIPKGLVRQEQYEAIAKDWIYPSINELRFHFLQAEVDSDKGFFAIEIPATVTSNKPFLVVKGTDDNRKGRRILFGYAERFRAQTLPVVVQRLQQFLHLGLNFANYESFQRGVETRLERLEENIVHQLRANEASVQIEREVRFKEHLAKATAEVAMGDRPRLILGSLPEPPVKLASLFSSREDPLVKAFENPPELRDAGFDFALGGRPSEILEGSIRRVAIQGYKSMQLSTEGELIVLVLGDEDFLAWASRSDPSQPVRINSFVIAEVVYVFALYVKRIYSYAKPEPRKIKLYIGLEDMTRENKPAILSSLEARPHLLHSEYTDKEAPASKILLSVEVPFDQKAERMGFLLRAELYHWFGFDDEHVPYVEELDGMKAVTRLALFKTA
jgi:hypothetical protein